MTATTSEQPGQAEPAPLLKTTRPSHFRWIICGLLFFATTLNYMDRQVLGLLKPTLQDPVRGIGMTEVQYAAIVSIFSAAYAIGLLLAGAVIDRVGTRVGYAAALGIWTIASIGHALAGFPEVTQPLHGFVSALAGLLGQIPGLSNAPAMTALAKLSGGVVCFGMARFVLGLGESGNFPASIKAVAEWFPRRERALATGIFNSGTNIGATIAPFAAGFLLYHFGWQFAFLGTSFFAAVWLVLWLRIYRAPRDHPQVSLAELAIIQSDPAENAQRVAWPTLLRHRQTWAFLIGKLMTDPIWWFFLYWLPGFLNAHYGLTLAGMGVPLFIIYNVCTVGSVTGGWLPQRLFKMGWSLNGARKSAMLLYALAVLPIVFIGTTHTLWQAIALIALATAAHQAWSANLFTLASDMFPRGAVASVVGIGACAGSVAMTFFGLLIGFVLQITKGNYMPLFFLAGTQYLLALLLIHLLAPQLEAARLD